MEVNLVLLIFCYLFILMTCIIYKIVFNADIKKYEWYHKTTDIFNVTKNKGWFFQLKGSEKKLENAKQAITAHFNFTYSKFI